MQAVNFPMALVVMHEAQDHDSLQGQRSASSKSMGKFTGPHSLAMSNLT
jgi:hypothetical protein